MLTLLQKLSKSQTRPIRYIPLRSSFRKDASVETGSYGGHSGRAGLAKMILLLFCAALDAGHYTYLIKIQAPVANTSLHGWRMLYKGDVLTFHGSLAKLVEKRCPFSFSLVITPEVQCIRATALSGLRHIELIPGCAVRWFTLNLTLVDGLWKWDIEELAQENIPQRLPHNALIFLFDPHLVEHVGRPHKTNYSLDFLHETGHCTFELPYIKLEGSEEQLRAALVQSQHALISVWSHHRPSSSVMQIINGTHCAFDIS